MCADARLVMITRITGISSGVLLSLLLSIIIYPRTASEARRPVLCSACPCGCRVPVQPVP